MHTLLTGHGHEVGQQNVYGYIIIIFTGKNRCIFTLSVTGYNYLFEITASL